MLSPMMPRCRRSVSRSKFESWIMRSRSPVRLRWEGMNDVLQDRVRGRMDSQIQGAHHGVAVEFA